jgi:NTE family protein
MNAHAEILRNHPLFSRLSSRSLDQLTAHATLAKFAKGAVIYKEGSESEALYLVLSGRCQSIIHLPGGQEHIVNVYAPGDTFGERALIANDVHWTTVRVITDSTLLRIDGADVQQVLDRNPMLGRLLAHRMRDHLNRMRSTSPQLHAKLGQVAGFASVSPEAGGDVVCDRIAGEINRVTDQVVLLVRVRSGSGAPSLGAWQHEQFAVTGSFRLSEHVRAGNDGLARLDLFVGADPAEARLVASLIGHLATHYRYVLIHCAANVPDTMAVEFLLQSDLSYLLLRHKNDDLYRANALVRLLRAQPAGQVVQVWPIVCLGDNERANPNQTLAGQIGVEVHGYLHDAPGPSRPGETSAAAAAASERFRSHIRHLAREISRRRIGLALSSGGAKGLSHIGIIQVLEENGIDIDVVTAASMGAYVGAMWCYGIPGPELEKLAMEFERPLAMLRIIDPALTPRRGFMRGERIPRLLRRTIGDAHFSDLVRQLRVVATNLDTLERQVFESGEVAPCVHASMAMPGVIVPVRMNGHTFIDGGVVDPIPVDVLLEMGVDRIIAVNTIPNVEEMKACSVINQAAPAAEDKGIVPPVVDRHLNYFYDGNILDVFVRSMQGSETRVAEQACRQADVVLRPISCDGKWHDFRNARKYIALGRKVAENQLEELKALTK